MVSRRFLWPLAATFFLVVSARREPINPDQGWILVRGYRSLYGSDSGNFFYNQDSPQFIGHFWDLCVTVVDLIFGSFVSLEFVPALLLGLCILGLNFSIREGQIDPGLVQFEWASVSLVFLLIVQDGAVSARPEVLVALASVLLWRSVLTSSPLSGLALTTSVLALATAQSGLTLVPLLLYSLWQWRMDRKQFVLVASQLATICLLLIPIKQIMRGYEGYSRSHSLSFSIGAELERYANLFDFPTMRPLGLVVLAPLVSIAFILEPTVRARSIGFLLAVQPLMLLSTGSKWHWHLFALAPSVAICVKSRLLLTGCRRRYADAVALLLCFFLANSYASIAIRTVSLLMDILIYRNPIQFWSKHFYDMFVVLCLFLVIAVLFNLTRNGRLGQLAAKFKSRYLTSLLAVPVAYFGIILYTNFEYLTWQQILSACALLACALNMSRKFATSMLKGGARSRLMTLVLFTAALSFALTEQIVSSADQSVYVQSRGRSAAICQSFLDTEIQLDGSNSDTPPAAIRSLIDDGHVVASPAVVSAFPCLAALFANVQSYRSPIVTIGSNHPTGWELGLISGLTDVPGSGRWRSSHCESGLCVWVVH